MEGFQFTLFRQSVSINLILIYQQPEFPIGVEPVTYEENENDISDDQDFDISQFMEEVNEEGELEIEDNLMSSELDVSHDENMEEILEHPESNIIMNTEAETH